MDIKIQVEKAIVTQILINNNRCTSIVDLAEVIVKEIPESWPGKRAAAKTFIRNEMPELYMDGSKEDLINCEKSRLVCI